MQAADDMQQDLMNNINISALPGSPIDLLGEDQLVGPGEEGFPDLEIQPNQNRQMALEDDE